MFFSADDEDADFSLGAGGRSRLSSLFSAGPITDENPNQALTYTAPKQPKKTDNQQSSGPNLVLIYAVAVHTYKLETGKFASQGKLGAAILGNHETFAYKLLLYKGKQQQVTCCTISPSFVFTIQPKNYANFYDEKKENWSLMFDSEQIAADFAKQIALAKANSAGNNLTSTIIQDLTLGEGTALESGDLAELQYTGWLLTNNTFGAVFDTNINAEKFFRLRLGKGKVIKGWEEGLVGAMKNGRRLIIIPPNLAYGAQGYADKVPPNAILIFEIVIKKMKLSRESSHSPSPITVDGDSGERKPEIPSKPQSQSYEDTIRMRGASISEQLTQSPKKDKAIIISRMAKMGMPTLPMQGAVAAQPSSESEPEEDTFAKVERSPTPSLPSRSRESSPKPVPKPRTSSVGTAVAHPVHPLPVHGMSQTHPTQPVAIYQQAGPHHHQQYTATTLPFQAYQHAAAQPSPFSMLQQPFPSHPISALSPSVVASVSDAHLPLLLTETRNQNTEVRLSVNKISDKVDSVLQKLDDMKSQQGNLSLQSQLPYMEAAIVMHNVQRIFQENSRLKQEAEEKSLKIQSLNEKICDLLQRNQKFFEESNNILEQRSDSLHSTASQSQARLLSLEQEKSKLTSELADSVAKLSVLQLEISNHLRTENELKYKIKISEEETEKKRELLENLKDQTKEHENLVTTLQQSLNEAKLQKKELLLRIQNLEEKISDLEDSKEKLKKNLTDRKHKFEEMKKKYEDEMDEMTSINERKIENLKAKLFKERSFSAIGQGQEPLAGEESQTGKGMGKELEFLTKIENLKEEKEELEMKLEKVQSKLAMTESKGEVNIEELNEIQKELEHTKMWKNKYDTLYNTAQNTKEKYEAHVGELMAEIRRLQSSKTIAEHHSSYQEFAAEIKKVMNALYRSLQSKIDVTQTYTGSEVMELSLVTIRGVTLQLLEMRQQSEPVTCNETDSDKASPSLSLSDNQPNKSCDLKEALSEANEEHLIEKQAVQKEVDSLSPHSNSMLSTNFQICDVESQECSLLKSCDFDNENVSSTIKQFEDIDAQYNHTEVSDFSNNEKESSNNDREDKSDISNLLQTKDDCSVASFENNHNSQETEQAEKSTLVKEEKKTPEIWRPQPPPPPLFDEDDEDEDDWLK